jgi:hypothetical protein
MAVDQSLLGYIKGRSYDDQVKIAKEYYDKTAVTQQDVNDTFKAAPSKQSSIADLLPAAGGIAGSMLGSVADVFSGPVGTIAGAAGGQALGEALRQMVEGQQTDIGAIGSQALTGGISGGIGELGGAALGAVGKALGFGTDTGGEAVALAGSQATQKAAEVAGEAEPKGLLEKASDWLINKSVPGAESVLKSPEEVTNWAKLYEKFGLKSSQDASNLLEDVGGRINDALGSAKGLVQIDPITSDLSDALKQSALPISTKTDIQASIKDMLDFSAKGASKSALKKAATEWGQLSTLEPTETAEGIGLGMNAKNAYQVVQNIDGNISQLFKSAYDKAGNLVDRQALQEAGVWGAVKNNIVSQIDKIASDEGIFKGVFTDPETQGLLTDKYGKEVASWFGAHEEGFGSGSGDFSNMRSAMKPFVQAQKIANVGSYQAGGAATKDWLTRQLIFRGPLIAFGGYTGMRKNLPAAGALIGLGLFGPDLAAKYLAEPASKLLDSLVSPATGLTGAATAGAEALLNNPQQSTTEQVLGEIGQQGTTAMGGQTYDTLKSMIPDTSNYLSKLDQEKAQAIQQDLYQYGGRNISKIDSYYSALKATVPQLSGSDKTSINNYLQAVDAFNNLKSVYDTSVGASGFVGGTMKNLTGGSSAYQNAINTEILPIMKTLGTSSTAQAIIGNYEALLPSATDDPATAQQKWTTLQQQLELMGQEIYSNISGVQ